MRLSPQKTCEVIFVTAVLYNICCEVNYDVDVFSEVPEILKNIGFLRMKQIFEITQLHTRIALVFTNTELID